MVFLLETILRFFKTAYSFIISKLKRTDLVTKDNILIIRDQEKSHKSINIKE